MATVLAAESDPLADGNTAYGGKSIQERLTGRFYTPDILAVDLANTVADGLIESGTTSGKVTVCDPFCGDGRLIAAFLSEVASRYAFLRCHYVVTLCDIDSIAVDEACIAVASAASRLGLHIEIHRKVGDSFFDHGIEEQDAVLTNPPWELLKPDVRETANLSPTKAAQHRVRLKAMSAMLDNTYPAAKADRAWGGWSTNLARCGWELALRLCRTGGVLGIVLPATILADQTSATMRRIAFERSRLLEMAAYPAEARLFDRVDQPVVTGTFIKQPAMGIDAHLKIFRPATTEWKRLVLRLTPAELQARDYALPLGFGAEVTDLLNSFSHLPRLLDLEATGELWLGRELDETRVQEKLTADANWPFIKGRMVARHALASEPSLSVRADIANRFVSAQFDRVAWRDVARSSQQRRMIGTVIPKGWIAGNSLHVGHFRDASKEKLLALHATLSSYVFELQVRHRLTTGHMSLGVVRKVHIPRFTKRTVRTLSEVAHSALKAGAPGAHHLEVAVARAFDLDRGSFADIISMFDGVSAKERAALLSDRIWA